MSYVVKRKTESPAPPMRAVSTRGCPKCMYSMEPLRNSAVLNRDCGYSLDSASGFDPDNSPIMLVRAVLGGDHSPLYS